MRSSLVDKGRRIIAIADSILARNGLRPIRAGVLAEGATKSFGLAEAIYTEHTRWFTPPPAVRKLDVIEASNRGLSLAPLADGRTGNDVYEIGPIVTRYVGTLTCACLSGETTSGTSVEDLFPVDSTAQSRSRIVLADERAGGELGRGGKLFAIERMRSDEVGFYLYVVATQEVADF